MGTLISACGNSVGKQNAAEKNTHGEVIEVEMEKGSHGGRLLKQDNFTLELSIFETGVPPEFRAWATFKGKLLKPTDVELNIKLIRLSNNPLC